MGDEEFDQYLNEATASVKDPVLLEADPSLLNADQKSVYDRYLRYFLSKKDAIETGSDHPAPLKFLIHGGPGKQIKKPQYIAIKCS